MPKLEALRTRAETKLLHSFAPWSRGGYTHLCNLELLYQHHAMLNFPWSCFCKVDLKKGFDISVIFKLLLVFQHLSLLDCPPAPKDQHPNHCHHLMLLFHYSRARRSICISKTNWRLTKHCKSKYCFLQFSYGEQSSLWALIWRQGKLGCPPIICSRSLRRVSGSQPSWWFCTDTFCWMGMRESGSCSRNWCTTNQQESL